MLRGPTVGRYSPVIHGYLELIFGNVFLAKLLEKPVKEILGKYLRRAYLKNSRQEFFVKIAVPRDFSSTATSFSTNKNGTNV